MALRKKTKNQEFTFQQKLTAYDNLIIPLLYQAFTGQL